MQEPLCPPGRPASGYLRFFVSTGLPFVSLLLILSALQCCVVAYMRRRSRNAASRERNGLWSEVAALRSYFGSIPLGISLHQRRTPHAHGERVRADERTDDGGDLAALEIALAQSRMSAETPPRCSRDSSSEMVALEQTRIATAARRRAEASPPRTRPASDLEQPARQDAAARFCSVEVADAETAAQYLGAFGGDTEVALDRRALDAYFGEPPPTATVGLGGDGQAASPRPPPYQEASLYPRVD